MIFGGLSRRFTVLSGAVLWNNSISLADAKDPPLKDQGVYDVCVIGGGIVGLAVARECAVRHKASVILIEKEYALASG